MYKLLKSIVNQDLVKLQNKELVIGIYEGLPIITKRGGIDRFLNSLRKVNKKCTIIIWCQKDKYIKEYNELELKYNCYFLTYNIFLDSHIQTRRLYLTKFFLQLYKNYENILMSDMDDVYFQKDPFQIELKNNNFYCALENNNYSSYNKSVKVNLGWLQHIPINDFTIFRDEYIVCSGTIYGKYSSILEYLEWVFDNRRNNAPGLRGIDQGYWNEYIYVIKNKKKIIMEKLKYSQILTCDRVPYIKKNSDNKIINDRGEEYHIVHQLDRIDQNKSI